MDCIICLEKIVDYFNCEECHFKFCSNCSLKIGRCPQCRHIYDPEKDRVVSMEILRDYEDSFTASGEIDFQMLYILSVLYAIEKDELTSSLLYAYLMCSLFNLET